MKTYQDVSYANVNITGGFWQNRQKINAEITSRSVYNRFSESHRFEALDCRWKEGMNYHPHIFWDSDVAKWIEGAAYIIGKAPDAELEALCDNAISMIARNQTAEGYFNSHYQVMNQDERFKHRGDHELYCAGHLMEAACAYYEATGKATLLDVMCRYADYIYDTFYLYQTASFLTSGHPEIELALVKLARTLERKAASSASVTDECAKASAAQQTDPRAEKYMRLARHFLDKRGRSEKDINILPEFNEYYAQDHLPLDEQTTAEGHCVRAMYLYSAMADIARLQNADNYRQACEAIYENTVTKKMYITGGLGSSHIGESFAADYFLPNNDAYTETCAALSLALFCKRMLLMAADSKYADTIERVIYNGFLSGVSLDGRSFFYENPLEIDPYFYDVNTSTRIKRHIPIMQRLELFGCSCCPPNVLRFIASIGDYLYTHDDDTLYVHQFMNSESTVRNTKVTQRTEYPADGTVQITVDGNDFDRIAVRVPGWCETFKADQPYIRSTSVPDASFAGNNNRKHRNSPSDAAIAGGYLIFENCSEVTITFDMPVQLYESNAAVQNNAGCVAVMRGPVVYCAEEVDNGKHLRSLRLDPSADFELLPGEEYHVPILKTTGLRKKEQSGLYHRYSAALEQTEITLIPYFAFANRGVSEMLVWIPVKE